MRTRSFIAAILVLGFASGALIAHWRASIPETKAASGAAQTFNQLITGFIDTDEFVEYWKDFTRNTCQRDEIFRMHDEMDATRASLRAALYGTVVTAANSAVTGSETTVADPQTYVDKYRDESVELYYLRNFVKSYEIPLVGAPTPGHVEATDKTTLYNDMYARFVEKKGWYSSDADFQTLFDTLESNYTDKKQEFLECSGASNIANLDPEFKEIKDRWDHLVATFQALKNLKKSFTETFPPKSTALGTKNADKSSVGSFFQQHFGFKLNGTCPKKGLSEIVSNLGGTPYGNAQNTQTNCKSVAGSETSSSSSTGTSSSVTFSQAALSSTVYAQIYDLDYQKAVLAGEYATLYGDGADSTLANLVNLLKYEEGSESLDTYIRTSIPVFNKWEDCAKTVNNKFCS